MDIAFESSSTSAFQWKAFRDADVDSDVFALQTGCIVLLYLYHQVVSSLSIPFFKTENFFLYPSCLAVFFSLFLGWNVSKVITRYFYLIKVI